MIMGIKYSVGDLQLDKYRFTGEAASKGGEQPRVSLQNYPLLAWTHLGHQVHEFDVFTEDQRASVTEIARSIAETPSFDAIAKKFGTTEAHVEQALDYAMEAGILVPGN